MATIPETTKQALGNRLENDHGIHPAMLFYRMYEPAGNQDDKHGQHLKRARDLNVGHLFQGRQDGVVQALLHEGKEVRDMRMPLQTRLAAGLGISSPTENGITLDHTHGLPMLSGSSLKGIAQDGYLKSRLGPDAADNPGARWAEKNTTEFIALFGMQTPLPDEREFPKPWKGDRCGLVTFLDAFPVQGGNLFDVDVMTPHYSEYYASQGGRPPADYLKINPVKFLTVKKGVEFRFTLFAGDALFNLVPNVPDDPNPRPEECFFEGATLADTALSSLKWGLENLGAGGKTRAGYGTF